MTPEQKVFIVENRLAMTDQGKRGCLQGFYKRPNAELANMIGWS
jgi:hypothetical protein